MNGGNGGISGHVRVYTYSNSSDGWTQLGADIDGEYGGDWSGWSVSLSADGRTVAIGAILNDGANGTDSGHVRVYTYSSGWTQLGADIDGEFLYDFSGYSVSLSADGYTVAIGAPYNGANDRGHVRVYTFVKPPQFTSATSVSVSENISTSTVYTVAATHTNDSSPLTYTISGGADASKFAIDSAGNISFIQSPSYASPVDNNQDNIYEIIVKASDGSLSSTQAVTITLTIAPTVTITGTATQGQTLTASNNLVAVYGAGTITYQWKANGVAIAGATGTAYTLTQSDVGKTITVTATYTDLAGNSTTITSSETAAVANINDQPTGEVTITGTATQGQTLTASNTLSDPDGLGTISYQWKADGVAISGATGTAYTLTQSDVGKAITVTASYTDSQGTAESKTSNATATVVICFPAGTPVLTNHGYIPIEQIDPSIHTIRNKAIIAITQTVSDEAHLIRIAKNALGNNYPTKTTLISQNHQVMFMGHMIKAKDLVGLVNRVTQVPYNGEPLYNVLLETHDKMQVNNLIVETLHPEHKIAQLYKLLNMVKPEERDQMIALYNRLEHQHKQSIKK